MTALLLTMLLTSSAASISSRLHLLRSGRSYSADGDVTRVPRLLDSPMRPGDDGGSSNDDEHAAWPILSTMPGPWSVLVRAHEHRKRSSGEKTEVLPAGLQGGKDSGAEHRPGNRPGSGEGRTEVAHGQGGVRGGSGGESEGGGNGEDGDERANSGFSSTMGAVEGRSVADVLISLLLPAPLADNAEPSDSGSTPGEGRRNLRLADADGRGTETRRASSHLLSSEDGRRAPLSAVAPPATDLHELKQPEARRLLDLMVRIWDAHGGRQAGSSGTRDGDVARRRGVSSNGSEGGMASHKDGPLPEGHCSSASGLTLLR